MKITNVEFAALFNLGNYSHERIALRATLEDGEDLDTVVEDLRAKVRALSVASGGNADQIYETIYHRRRDLEKINEAILEATEEWNRTADFLRAQGINPDAPKLRNFTPQLLPVKEEFVDEF